MLLRPWLTQCMLKYLTESVSDLVNFRSLGLMNIWVGAGAAESGACRVSAPLNYPAPAPAPN
jgi:hypothetical protein